MQALWVSRLLVSEATAEKIIRLHQIDPDDVRAAVVGVRGLRYSWPTEEDRGKKAIVKTRINGRATLVVLYVADPGWNEWWLGSAYHIEG